MIIESIDELNDLYKKIKNEIKKNPVEISMCSTPSKDQLKEIEGLIKAIYNSAEGKIPLLEIKGLVFSLFLEEHYSLTEEGSFLPNKKEGKLGMNKEQMEKVLTKMVGFFNDHYGLNLARKETPQRLNPNIVSIINNTVKP